MAEPAVQLETEPQQDRLLLRTMMHAYCWMDDGLQAYMRREAGFSLPRAQSMIMVCLSDGIVSQSELAQRLQVSKQAIQQALRSMVKKGMVTIDPDPLDGRQRVVRVTPQGEAMRDIARRGIAQLQDDLGRRIGAERLEALHDALNVDWGPVPE
ncbi:MAG: MarR family winged helix-turn-helix transcriptional regulator [Pseudomonadales bacterium]